MIKDIIESNENMDLNANKIEKLKEVLPNCFDKDGKLDLELLKKDLNNNMEFSKESFELNFLGKSYAKMIAGLDTETVIEPDLENNSKEENKNSKNIYISGDNLDALKHLLKAYERKIKCIYIDPPYNTGNDGFVYNDTYKFTITNLIDKLDISAEEAERILDMTSLKSSSHSAWLTFMFPRLYISKQLLNNKGVIFISIGEDEYSNLKLICDEIYGEENYLTDIIWNSTKSVTNTALISNSHTHTLVYFKNLNYFIANRNEFRLIDDGEGFLNPDNDPRGPWKADPFQVGGWRANQQYEIKNPKTGEVYKPSPGNSWKNEYEKFLKLLEDDRIVFGVSGEAGPQRKRFLFEAEERGKVAKTLWDEVETTTNGTALIKKLFNNKVVFSNPKPIGLIEKILQLGTTNNDDIVLDFFSGSASTSHAVLSYNAKHSTKLQYIAVQLPENLDENLKNSNNDNREIIKNEIEVCDECGKDHVLSVIGQERIKRAATKIKEETNADIDYGFKHYKLKETSEDLLNKLEEFKPELMNESYNLYKEYGVETILETWKLKDGYEFTTDINKIDCDGYEVYQCKECLYLINPNIAIKHIQALLNKYNKDDKFICDKLIIFGYSFKFNEIEMIKNNIKQVKNFKNIDVKVYTRY